MSVMGIWATAECQTLSFSQVLSWAGFECCVISNKTRVDQFEAYPHVCCGNFNNVD